MLFFKMWNVLCLKDLKEMGERFFMVCMFPGVRMQTMDSEFG